MTRAAIIIVLALLAGCHGKPEVVQAVNGEFVVETLFTKDGCTVYRFADGGYNRYFTNCRGSVQWREKSGKSTRDGGVEGGAP